MLNYHIPYSVVGRRLGLQSPRCGVRSPHRLWIEARLGGRPDGLQSRSRIRPSILRVESPRWFPLGYLGHSHATVWRMGGDIVVGGVAWLGPTGAVEGRPEYRVHALLATWCEESTARQHGLLRVVSTAIRARRRGPARTSALAIFGFEAAPAWRPRPARRPAWRSNGRPSSAKPIRPSA